MSRLWPLAAVFVATASSAFAQYTFTLQPAQVFRAPGGTIQLVATVTRPDGTQTRRYDCAWTSSNPAVVRVDTSSGPTSGTATALTLGTTTIFAKVTAADGSILTATSTMTVRDWQLTLKPASFFVLPSGGVQYVLDTTSPDGTTKQALNTDAQWISSNPGVAGVSATGRATPAAVGSTTITAKLVMPNGVLHTSSASLAVRDYTLDLKPDSGPFSLGGGSVQYVATVTRPDGSVVSVLPASAQWSSSNPAAATIDASGKATLIAVGDTTMTVRFQTADGVLRTDTSSLQVREPRLEVTPASVGLGVNGSAARFQATVTRIDGTKGPVVPAWSSSNPAVATVDAAGNAVGTDGGTATFTAQFRTQDGVMRQATTGASVWGARLLPVRFVAPGQTWKAPVVVKYPGGNEATLGATAVASWAAQFTSSDPAVATVDSTGVVTGRAPGLTTITFRGSEPTYHVVVSGSLPVQVSVGWSVAVEPASIVTPAVVTNPGGPGYIPARGQILTYLRALDGTEGPLSGQWSSSNTVVATINGDGQWTTSGNPLYKGNLSFTFAYRTPDNVAHTFMVPVQVQ